MNLLGRFFYIHSTVIEASDFVKACRTILADIGSIDLAMVIDKFANIIALASRETAESSVHKMTPEDIAKTAMRLNIAKGAFNAAREKTGASSIHAQYNAMDMVIYPLDNELTLIIIGFIDSQAIADVFNCISKEFPTKTKRAIIVDDEPDIRAAIEEVLKKRGFEVTLCDSGRACIHTLEKMKDENKEFGIIVLDIRMPDMDGFQVYKEVQAISPNTNVLFITAFEYTQKDISQKVSSSKVKMLRKPFSRAELLQSISESIETSNN